MTDLGSSIRRRRRNRGRRGKSRAKDEKRGSARRGRRRGSGRRAADRSKAPESGAPRSAGRPLLALLIAVATGGGGGYLVATQIFFPLPERPSDLQDVPELRNKPLDVALEALQAAELAVERIDSLRHPAVPAGTVLGQSPLPGFTALPGVEVRLAVSLGPELRPVPDVSRLPGERAAALISGAGFVVQVDTVESELPAGRVVGIDPRPGTRLNLPAHVALRVSLGPPTFPMPDLEGLQELAAAAVLSTRGLVVTEVEYRLSLQNGGRVFGQTPRPGTLVEAGTAVTLIVGERLRARPRARDPDPSR